VLVGGFVEAVEQRESVGGASGIPVEERGDPKAVTAWHGAGRAGLAHLAELLKRAEAVGSAAQTQVIDGLLGEARRQIGETSPEEKEEQDGDAGGTA
jgi:hypothetical protein